MEILVQCVERELDSPVSAATHRHDRRTHVVVRLAEGGFEGVGVVSTGPVAVNGDPDTTEVLTTLSELVLPRFHDRWRRGSVGWAAVSAMSPSTPAGRYATSALEMALAGLELATTHRSWEELFVPVAPLQRSGSSSLLDASFVARDVDRLRVKTAPEMDDGRFASLESLTVPVILDFNASATSIEDVLRQASAAARYVDVVAIEQPFAVGDLVQTAALRQCGVATALDESIRGVLDVRHAARYEAADLVCLKPPRLGGLAMTVSAAREARALGLGFYVGGLFDVPFVRAVHGALARSLDAGPSDVDPPGATPPSRDEGVEVGRFSFDQN